MAIVVGLVTAHSTLWANSLLEPSNMLVVKMFTG